MSETPDPGTIAASEAEGADISHLDLPQRQEVVLVMDLVESVRLMALNEVSVIGHWRGFLRHAIESVLPEHHGRLVKSLGDGIMAVFDSARNAVSAALALQHHFDEVNRRLVPELRLQLRAGLNATNVFVDDIDIFGSGVNLAARIASLAGPGETIVTAEVRDQLAEGLDARIEDMGECYLKHVAAPVRAFRVGPAGSNPKLQPQRSYGTPLHPTVAVIPFVSRSRAAEPVYIGELIADGVISLLGVHSTLRVVSRLSTSQLAQRATCVEDAAHALGADFVLTGSYLVLSEGGYGRLLLNASLVNPTTQEVLWADRFEVALQDLCAVHSEACQRVTSGVHEAILSSASRLATRQPMPTVASYALLLSAITLMHRSTPGEMQTSRRMLEHLTERHPRAFEAQAWLAKSFVLNAVSTFANTGDDARRALSICTEVLARSSASALSLAVQAHVLTHMAHAPQLAQERLDEALRINPNEPLAWLFKSVLSAMWGDAGDAVTEAARANALSPADPLGYYFRMIEASACTMAGDSHRGIALAQDSIRLNRHHTPTWRVLITAQVLSGDHAGAMHSAGELFKLDPAFNLSRYLAAGNGDSKTKQQFVMAARELPIFKK